MKRTALFLLSVVLLSLFALSCKDKSNLVDPNEGIEPSMGVIVDTTDPISVLIMALYPDGGLENAALGRWVNIQRQWDKGQEKAAQSQVLVLVDEVIRMLERGELEDPSVNLTAETAVPQLIALLDAFIAGVSLGATDIDPTFFLSEDFGLGFIDPGATEETVIVTGKQWAAVVAPPGATEDPVIVTLNLLDEETCSGADDLTQARGCWDIDRYPAGEFEAAVKVEICVADTDPMMSQSDWDLLLVHHKDELSGEITALPFVETTEIDCEYFDPVAETQTTASLHPAASTLGAVVMRIGDFLLPEPLGASFWMRTRVPRGLGALETEFSEFFGAVPSFPEVTVSLEADGSVPNEVPTIQEALLVVQPGGTILMGDGTHEVEDVIVNIPVTIDEVDGATAVIENNNGLTSLAISQVGSGLVTIQNLDFHNLSPGGHYWEPGFPEEVTHTSSIEIAGEYDQVVVQYNTFDPVQSSGVSVQPGLVPGATVLVGDNGFTGGLTGVSASGPREDNGFTTPKLTITENRIQNSGLMCLFVEDILEVTISENTLDDCGLWGGMWVFNGEVEILGNEISDATLNTGEIAYHNAIRFTGRGPDLPRVGLISGNTIDGCGWGSCIQIATTAEATVSNNTIYGYFEHGTVVGILGWGGNTSYDPLFPTTVTFTDNIIEGRGSDPNQRPFLHAAISLRNAIVPKISGNSVTNAAWGFAFQKDATILDVSDNVVDQVTGAVKSNDFNGSISMAGNDFTNWDISIRDVDGTFTGSLACNWWGSVDGPTNTDLQTGSSPIVLSPWANDQVANEGPGTCTVTTDLPDLVVTDITLLTPMAALGEQVTFAYTIANAGAEAPEYPGISPTFDMIVYLSSDQELDAEDVHLPFSYSNHQWPISEGWSYTNPDHDAWIQDNPAWPGYVPQGDYYLIALVNAKINWFGFVESDETNNWLCSASTLTILP